MLRSVGVAGSRLPLSFAAAAAVTAPMSACSARAACPRGGGAAGEAYAAGTRWVGRPRAHVSSTQLSILRSSLLTSQKFPIFLSLSRSLAHSHERLRPFHQTLSDALAGVSEGPAPPLVYTNELLNSCECVLAHRKPAEFFSNNSYVKQRQQYTTYP